MSVPLDQSYLRMGVDPQLNITPNWTIDVSDVRTVKVSNLSLSASERDVKEFFGFSGEINFVEIQGDSEMSQVAYVTFKDSQGADTAVLLSGATIVDRQVSITPVNDYQLPPQANRLMQEGEPLATNAAIKKAEDVVSSMLARGFVLGKDVLHKAKTFDEQHQLLSNASATVASLDRRIGLSEKITTGTTLVSGKVREVDERFQVSEITKSAFAVAEQTATNAGSAIMSNRFVSTGASWMSSAFGMVVKAAEDVSTMTKEKVEKVEEERKEVICMERREMVSEYAQLHLDDPLGEPATLPISSLDEPRLHIL